MLSTAAGRLVVPCLAETIMGVNLNTGTIHVPRMPELREPGSLHRDPSCAFTSLLIFFILGLLYRLDCLNKHKQLDWT